MEKKSTLQKAIEFATIAHSGQKRRSGEDFINHPIRVKNHLKEVGIKDENMLCAAMLHSVLNTTDVTEEELENNFNSEIIYLVYKLRDIGNITIPIKGATQRVSNLHQLFIHLTKDMRVLLIRLADRVDNINTSHGLRKEAQQWLAKKAIYLYAPISKAIGLNSYHKTFEKEAFKILNHKRYKRIREFKEQRLQNADLLLEATTERLAMQIREITDKFEISYRTKSSYSIHKKAVLKAQKGTIASKDDLTSLYDLLGIRILVKDVATCYKVLEKILKRWKAEKDELDDYIQNPKPNGYKSIQIPINLEKDLQCEIQIRTFKMHEFNEYGAASHFAYKYGSNKQHGAQWIKQLIAMKDDIQKEIVSNSRIKLFEDKIFVFTPENDVIWLPKDSTPIDFAYEIHSDIGDHCWAAKVNGKLTNLKYKLKSGNVVKILTKRNQKPSKDWLLFAKTHEARRHIKKSIHTSS